MARHVIAPLGAIPDGGLFTTKVQGRPIVVFNRKGELFALLDRCPHSGAALSQGLVTGLVQSDGPGCFNYSRDGEIIKCPWHGWEFDIRSGQSYCSPRMVRTRAFDVKVESGCELQKGPFVAETLNVSVEDDYAVLEM